MELKVVFGRFHKHVMLRERHYNTWSSRCSETVQPSIYNFIFSCFQLPVPNTSEQKTIYDTPDSADSTGCISALPFTLTHYCRTECASTSCISAPQGYALHLLLSDTNTQQVFFFTCLQVYILVRLLFFYENTIILPFYV